MESSVRPVIIAGPCVAESYSLMQEVAAHMHSLCCDLGFRYVFKASFDKANRTSAKTYRGPGLQRALNWLADIKSEFGIEVLTDIHECNQAAPVAEICDWLQIPAFLCRQTDLLLAALETGRTVNVKKGQFLAPQAVQGIFEKAESFSQGATNRLWLTERGSCFGYGDLVVDMRSFPIMAQTGLPVIFDVTHSLQQPPGGQLVSGGRREFAAVQARAAVATGYVDGLFVEVHPDPKTALSDAATQLDPRQAEVLLRQIAQPLIEREASRSLDDIYVTG